MARDESDEELLARYQRAEFSAFDSFYRRRQHAVIAFLVSLLGNRADAEDAFQEAWLRIHRSIMSYDPRQKAMAWVFTIARNAAIDTARKRQRRRESAEEDVPGEARSHLALEAKEELARLLADLSENDRSLLASRLLLDESFEETARRHGVSSASARQRVSRLLKKLRAGGPSGGSRTS